jgi:cellulose synthase (UDP-forming)
VQDTVLAALSMDYPRDRFRVYVLDDGRRPEFKAFAEAAGALYITRTDNKHAKAGNLNNALGLTDGELVCIFDADHIPTRAFLQVTVGWFQADPRLALLQTPHHFYSPDPVQRNLRTVKDVPDEGALFYGVVQPGNDFWNAAFFCGSCAVIRREALKETKGFAGETVTEDAHTALKLQRRGWNSAYLDIRLASGLATERLALHIGQRARWARGMIQIFRVDNPLFGPGLSLAQRLCYLNAMLHFFFPLPRIVFLTSPWRSCCSARTSSSPRRR